MEQKIILTTHYQCILNLLWSGFFFLSILAHLPFSSQMKNLFFHHSMVVLEEENSWDHGIVDNRMMRYIKRLMKQRVFTASTTAILICIIVILAGLTGGCRRPGPPRDTIVISLSADPLYLNPVLASEMISIQVNGFIFNSLLKFNADLELTGDLAESWTTSEDGKVWTFSLRHDVRWHDGVPFTARDVQFTFEKLFDPATSTYNRGLFQIDGTNPQIRVIDEHCIQFILPKPFAPFITNLAQMGIIPAHLLKDGDINRCDFNWHPIGTGPFKFKKWDASEKIYLVANPDYFNGPPRLGGILFLIIPSAESRRIALMTGTIDASNLSTEDIRVLKKKDNINLYSWSQFSYYYLGFDLTRKLFQDRNVRQAINYAIDKKNIVNAVLQGTARAATGPIPLASWAYTDKVEMYNYNPDRARQLLRSSGWTAGKDGILRKGPETLEFTIMYSSGSPQCEKASVFIQANLKDVGIRANLKSTEFSALINSCNPGDFQSVMLDWVENFDPDCFVEWHSSQTGTNGMNFMSYRNHEVDLILQQAREVSEREKRKELYARFQRIVVEDAPYVFLWNPDAVVAINRRVKGLAKAGPAGLFINAERAYLEQDPAEPELPGPQRK